MMEPEGKLHSRAEPLQSMCELKPLQQMETQQTTKIDYKTHLNGAPLTSWRPLAGRSLTFGFRTFWSWVCEGGYTDLCPGQGTDLALQCVTDLALTCVTSPGLNTSVGDLPEAESTDVSCAAEKSLQCFFSAQLMRERAHFIFVTTES